MGQNEEDNKKENTTNKKKSNTELSKITQEARNLLKVGDDILSHLSESRVQMTKIFEELKEILGERHTDPKKMAIRDLNAALDEACHQGNPYKIAKLLKQGVYIPSLDEFESGTVGWIFFNYFRKNIGLLKLIIEKSKNKEFLYKAAFQHAFFHMNMCVFKSECIPGWMEIVLLEFKNYIYIKLIMFLLNECADYKEFKEDIVFFVTLFGRTSDMKKLYEQYGFDKFDTLNKGLLYAAAFERKLMAKHCVENGADVNFKDSLPFYVAAKYCQLSTLEFLINKGAILRVPNFDTDFPVYHKKGVAVVKLLIKYGFDIHEDQEKILRDACANRDIRMVKYLINQGADLFATSPETIIESACRGGSLNILKYLVAKGVNIDVNFAQSLNTAVYCNHIEIMQYLVSHITNLRSVLSNAISSACYYSSSTLIQALLDNGISIKEMESEALYFCLCQGNMDFADRLAAMGFNIHFDNDRLFQRICGRGDIEILNYLLKRGANLHAGNEGGLRYACEMGLFNVVIFLAEAGADLHVNNDEPLKLACSAKQYRIENSAQASRVKDVKINDHFSIVKYLIGKGANIRNDKNSILLAACSGHDAQLDIVKYLINKGADVNLVKDQLLSLLKENGNHDIYHYILDIIKKSHFH